MKARLGFSVAVLFSALIVMIPMPASACSLDQAPQGSWVLNPTTGNYYALTEGMIWECAEAQAVLWGGHLVTLHDWDEELWIKDTFGRDENFWIGFNDIQEEGNWVWSSGAPVTYTNWDTGEPNNCLPCSDQEGENAAVMNWAHEGHGDYWNDLAAHGHARGVVEVGQHDLNPNAATVYMYGDNLAFRTVDPMRRLTAVYGLGVEDPAQSLLCGAEGQYDVMSVHEVVKWMKDNSDNPILHQLINGRDVTQHVYNLDEWAAGNNICERLNTRRLAQGFGNFRLKDTDYYATGNRTDSFSINAQGTLEDLINGGRVRLNDVQHATVRPDGILRWIVRKIQLKSKLSVCHNGNTKTVNSEDFGAHLKHGDLEGPCNPACVDPPPGLVSWWPADGNTDDVISGNHGELVGGSGFAPGMVGDAFSLDGIDGFINIPHNDNLNVGEDDFTIDMWMYYVSTNDEQVLIEKYVEVTLGPEPWPDRNGWSLTKLDGDVYSFAGSPAFHNAVVAQLAVPTNTWIFVALTREGDVLRFYWDGGLLSTVPYGVTDLGTAPDVSLKIGHRGHPDDTPGSTDDRGFYMNGLVDELEFYDRALSDDEIMQIFNAGSGGKCKP